MCDILHSVICLTIKKLHIGFIMFLGWEIWKKVKAFETEHIFKQKKGVLTVYFSSTLHFLQSSSLSAFQPTSLLDW